MIDAYNAFRARNPELFGNPADAAYQIVFKPDLQRDAGAGVVYQDPYVILLRDAVRFRDGRVGGYVRLVHTAGPAGAALLGLCGGEIVLLRHFRHATRSWHWEIPRGFADAAGETGETTAAREGEEELGAAPTGLRYLGRVHTDTGITPAAVEIYLAELPELCVPEAAEGIDEVRTVTLAEFDDLVLAGEITDSFTLAAVSLARLRGELGS